MTVSPDELMELLQVIETLVVLDDMACAVVTVRDWIRAHPGEARVIHDMGSSEDLFSHMTLGVSNLVRFALNNTYVNMAIQDSKISRSKMQLVLLDISRPGTPGRPHQKSCVWNIMKLFIASLASDVTLSELQQNIHAVKHCLKERDSKNDFFADEVQKIVVWNREERLAQQATIRALRGDFETTVRYLFALLHHLKATDSDDLYLYTGLPYVPGPEDEL